MLIRLFMPFLLTSLTLATAVTIKVQPGDTFTRLALRYNSSVAALQRANPSINPEKLLVGATLTLPRVESTGAFVSVRAGDTLSRIALMRGVTVGAILKVNPGVNAQRALQVGQRLRLPQVAVNRATTSVAVVRPTGIRVTAVMPLRGHLTTPYWSGHEGLDLAAPTGTLIRAALGGVVKESRFDGRTGWGWTVVLDHGNGLKTRYSHNSANLARVGARVNQGEVIARVGSTGNSTGPHVDYRMALNGRAINPASLN